MTAVHPRSSPAPGATLSDIEIRSESLGGSALARAAIARGRLSDRRPHPEDTTRVTLEPRRKGLGILAPSVNWPGLLLVALGAAMLLLPTVF